jgi:hypothetical protein
MPRFAGQKPRLLAVNRLLPLWHGFRQLIAAHFQHLDGDEARLGGAIGANPRSLINGIQDVGPFDALGIGSFATTTSPYKEKQCSATIAMPLDLRRDICTADITTSLRSGTTAMALALNSIKRRRGKQLISDSC